jgi:hypothetical protein
MNTARIVVLAIAVGAGGALACPDTATRGTGLIAQARRTSAQLPTLQSLAYGHLAPTGDRTSGRLESVNIAPRHADPGDDAELTMRKKT